ncbi:MAG: hypothetical protein ACK5GP_03955 [bacterium]|jgi:hypothetical protein|nr:hypothetical protein [Chitinophagaceae bacterium]
MQKTSNNSFIAIASAYLFIFITSSLINKFSSAAENPVAILNVLTSLIQAPLMLVLLGHLAGKSLINSLIKGCLAFLLAFSATSLALRGMGENNLYMIMMVGSIPVFTFSSILFIDQVKEMIYEKKGANNAILLSGIVFAFGSYFILLLLNRIDPQAHAGDFRIMLGLITLISGLVMAASLVYTKVDSKELEIASDRTPAQVGFDQWENFSLASTPDVIKKGVTDISKYYSGLQKTS